ncbi:MAG: hypothetical protein P8130_14215, partial [Deltaproteobacteria bacterium]
LAKQALAKAGEDQKIAKDVNTILIKVYQKQGNQKAALQLLYSTLEKDPDSIELRYILGMALLSNGPFMQLEKSAANLLLVCRQIPYDDAAYEFFGLAMAKRGRMRIAHSSLLGALRLNPKNIAVKKALAQFPEIPGDRTPGLQPANILLETYPSRSPSKLEQVLLDPNGRPVPDGIVVEWHENGRLKHFMDFDHGVPDGIELSWDSEGRVLSRTDYRHGKPVSSTKNLP